MGTLRCESREEVSARSLRLAARNSDRQKRAPAKISRTAHDAELLPAGTGPRPAHPSKGESIDTAPLNPKRCHFGVRAAAREPGSMNAGLRTPGLSFGRSRARSALEFTTLTTWNGRQRNECGKHRCLSAASGHGDGPRSRMGTTERPGNAVAPQRSARNRNNGHVVRKVASSQRRTMDSIAVREAF